MVIGTMIEKKKKGARPVAFLMIVAVAASIWLSCDGALAAQNAANQAQAQGGKTQNTIRAESELERLTESEKQLKGQITEATINRSKLLSQKRTELRYARFTRDESINKEISGIKDRKNRQTALIADMKKQLAQAKREKNNGAVSTLEVLLRLADIRLVEINEDLKKANGKLTQSYNDYKAVYEKLTEQDAQLKKYLERNVSTESAIKQQKEDFRAKKNEYNQSIRSKDYMAAERAMNALVSIQAAINANYERVLEVKRKVKDDYYEKIVYYRV